MKFNWVLLITILVCVVTACSATDSLSPPEDAYNNFLRACEAEDLSKAETYLSNNAIVYLQEQRAEVANFDEGDPLFEEFQKWGNPCYQFLHNGVNLYGFEIESDKPDAIEYYELDTDEIEDHTAWETGYEGVLEAADLIWILEGNTNPGETTYIETIHVMLVNINDEWKIERTSLP